MQLYDFSFNCANCVATYNWRVIDCITLWLSHAPVQPRNRSNVSRPFPARGFGSGNETKTVICHTHRTLLIYARIKQTSKLCTVHFYMIVCMLPQKGSALNIEQCSLVPRPSHVFRRFTWEGLDTSLYVHHHNVFRYFSSSF